MSVDKEKQIYELRPGIVQHVDLGKDNETGRRTGEDDILKVKIREIYVKCS